MQKPKQTVEPREQQVGNGHDKWPKQEVFGGWISEILKGESRWCQRTYFLILSLLLIDYEKRFPIQMKPRMEFPELLEI